MQNDSINRRFSYKILASAITSGLGLVAWAIVPRALGPMLYGQFDFLRSQFTTIINFMRTGTAEAFFNYNSRNKNSRAAIVFYGLFTVAVSLLVMLGTWAAILLGAADRAFPGIAGGHIMLGACVGLATWIFTVITGFGDSKGQTRQVEIIKVLCRTVGTAVLLAMLVLNAITLTTYLIYTIAVILAPAVISAVYYRKSGTTGRSEARHADEMKSVGKYFYTFCSPLMVYAVFSLVHDIFDRWFLQFAAGSQQQGYYALGLRFATICTLVILAINPVFMRELSKAHSEKRTGVMQTLFNRYLRMIYFLVAGLAVFFAFHSNEIIYMFGGEGYRNASWPFFLMALYPLSAVYGQLNSSVYFSTERTKTYRNILLVLMAGGLPISYMLMAPGDYFIPGLQLGAMGLSIKKLVVQFVAVNTLAFFNCRHLGASYRKLLFHQLFMFTSLAGALWVFKGGRVLSPPPVGHWWWIRMTLTGIAYSIFALAVIYCKPALAGMSRDELVRLRNKLPLFRKQK